MANQAQAHGVPFTVIASGTGTCTATKSAIAGATYYVTDVTASSATATLGSVTITGTASGASASTVLWANYLATGQYIEDFNTPLAGFISGTLAAVISGNGSVACFVNMSGYQIGPF